MLTSQDVASAYKLLLGREPESLEIIDNFVHHSDFDHLRQTLLGSTEFAVRLKNDPSILAVPLVALTMSEEVRSHVETLENLVSLDLALWGKSVLLVDRSAACLASYFLDHRCNVTLAAAPDILALLRIDGESNEAASSSTSLIEADFSSPCPGSAVSRYDVVYGELPIIEPNRITAWLDNAADACKDTLLLASTLAHGHSDELFMTHRVRTNGSAAIPTEKWVASRLAERFDKAYTLERRSFDSAAQKTFAPLTRQVLFVASRSDLNRASLTEVLIEEKRCTADQHV